MVIKRMISAPIIMMVISFVKSATLCSLTNSSIFETTPNPNSKLDLYREDMKYCRFIGTNALLANRSVCCSKEDFESLATRWQSTKKPVYENRIIGWSAIVKNVIENSKKYMDFINLLRSKTAAKIDCVKAAEETRKYFDPLSKDWKPEVYQDLWTNWRESAVKCLSLTLRLKVGLFCAICSAESYMTDPIFDDNGTDPTSVKILKIDSKHCSEFLAECGGFIKNQMIVRELVSAVAALSKCNDNGWTAFDQPYLYAPRDQAYFALVEQMIADKRQNPSKFTSICEREYSVSTLLASDLKDPASWQTFVRNAGYINARFDIKKIQKAIDDINIAGDEHSLRQDLPTHRVLVTGTKLNILSFEENSEFDLPPRSGGETYETYLQRLTSSSGLFSLALLLLINYNFVA